MFEEFHFLRPYFLLAFVLLAWLVWVAYRKSSQSNSWLKICDPSLVSHLLVGVESRTSLLPLMLLIFVGSILILALAGPAWQKLPQMVFKNDVARVYILDLSRSMDATDISPSRLSRAKLKLVDFLKSEKEGQVGLIAFAGLPHIVSPLTDDSNTIVSMVPSLSTDIMPLQGSSPEKALILAAQLLNQSSNQNGDIVLITDGVNTESLKSAQQISSEGFQLHVVAVGTAEGAPVPIAQGGFLNDKNGAIVIPRLDMSLLKELAVAGGGLYTTLTVDDSDIKKLKKSLLNDNASKNSDEFREVDSWRDEGHWLLLLALPLAALGFRRGWLGIFVLSLSFIPAEESMAFEWSDLWQRKDQQAQQALQQGNATQAAEIFENNDWKGTAYYRDGNFEKAAEAFSKSDSTEVKYNLANALARQGKLEEALKVYDEVIAKQPDHNDANFNRELIKKAIQNQQQNSEKNQQQNKDSKSNEQSQENQDQQGQSQNDTEQQQQQQQGDEQDTNKNQQQNEQTSTEQKGEPEDAKNDEQQQEELSRQQESKEGEEAERLKQHETEAEQSSEQKEIKQATQQWLRRIPDDPGGLMREKFNRQSQRERQRSNVENPW